jgi:hypothetical protein
MILFENAYLKIRCFNSVSDQILEVNLIEIMRNGKLIVEEYEFKPTNDRLENTFFIELPHAELKALTIKPKQTTVRGQTYCVASLQRGKGTGAKELITLLAGYISSAKPLSYPPISLENSTEGIGNIIFKTLFSEGDFLFINSPVNTLSKIYEIFGIANLNETSASNRLFLYKLTDFGHSPIYAESDTFISPISISFTIANFGSSLNKITNLSTDINNLIFITTDNIILLPNEFIVLSAQVFGPTDNFFIQLKVEELFYI